MASNYREMREAAVEVGHALERRGWKLYGFKEDRSDSMTDYFDPESWDGIATKGERTACVYVNGYQVESRSGKEETRRVPVPGDLCPRCQGSAVDPLGWTLEEARGNPALYLTDELRGRYLAATERTDTPSQKVALPDQSGSYVSWLVPVVSPIPFDKHGRQKCLRCQGRGHEMAEPRTEVLFTWPTFQANPKAKTWHVEQAGRIIDSGTGLKACSAFYNINRAAAKQAAEALAARIDGASSSRTAGSSSPSPSSDVPTLTENAEKRGLELRFPDKPDQEIREDMGRNGWRWSRFSRCWYHRDNERNRAYAEALIERLSPGLEQVSA